MEVKSIFPGLEAQHQEPEPALFATKSERTEGEKGHFTAEVPVRKEETELTRKEQSGRPPPYCRLSHVPSCGSDNAMPMLVGDGILDLFIVVATVR